jgi:DNA-binding NarL/FixJ family response regulator
MATSPAPVPGSAPSDISANPGNADRPLESDTAEIALIRQELRLTTRRAGILYWAAKGKSHEEIGPFVRCSPNSIKAHLQAICIVLRVGRGEKKKWNDIEALKGFVAEAKKSAAARTAQSPKA